ncbi:hypothetical protein [Jidongwangia harbinensis]|uniref:hypothetical protein n=1 Tax=Jidongwangia harbinensis TaxID=2878561 RepID=UPI001CD91CC1|nr:hypothetical protein [Jidongwangia harbinensis]MCA2213941.1 hypothetical protein [Jidongwangia harbinensis]
MRRFVPVIHLVPAAAVLSFAVLAGGAPDPRCTPATPCPPGPADWLLLGTLLAPALMVYAHRPAAAWAATGGAAVWLLPTTFFHTTLGWRLVVPWAYAALVTAVARRAGPRPRTGAPCRMPPRPRSLPAVATPSLLSGTALLLAAVSAGLAVPWRTDRTAPWLTVVVAAAGLGAALLARGAHRRRGLRALFTGPQPVRDVRVVDQLGYLHVLVPSPDGRTAVEFGVDTADGYSSRADEDDEPETLPAVLYGEPRTGGWCAVEVAGRLHVPVEPVGATVRVPYDPDHGLPREVSDDEDQLVDPDALTDADRAAPPAQEREHRVAPGRAWCSTVGIGLGAALAAAEMLHRGGVTGWAAAATVAVVAAAGHEFGWRTQLRPRLRWHTGGVAAVGFRDRIREPWTVDSAAVHDDAGTVILTAGDSVLTVPAPRPWPSWSDQRDADQLVAALRLARTRAFAGGELPPPPAIDPRRRPLLLYAAWAGTVAAALALFGR